ncbi:MFS transporter [Pusillimonas noertemannii]|uniref:Alpha-ketoglutarate permease n=1 Tax=Pusillimonas noertemannii TaxID=305977 RepID=A0A2U1CJ33_9BURK|nr:MFS transporter [Pusillimonas noertemannii]NYT70045.1 MFS transporter [Pusillimonas noertemannii]PVY60992.1 MHS family alpha-ketoglutarate permease-like MFS transporter [Pusillimonas noertemannii]TFL08352.1 MFS transporter [Pusillimonas noertemannii]
MADIDAPNLPSNLRRSVSNTLKGSAGNLVEWYDVYVYSVFAASFEHHFFSPDDKNADIYIWAIFALTFLMRPFGSWYFGRYADRKGRRAALTLSVTIMSLCSFAIAVTPTRLAIGEWAAIILIMCRLLQGFATGGEYGTSATYLSEAAVPKHRGFLASFHYVTLVGGHVLAQALFLALMLSTSKADIGEWGWRLAFAIGGVGAIVVLWLRRTMDESMSQEAIKSAKKDKGSGSMVELVSNYWKELTACFLVTMGGTVAFYAYSINGPNIIKSTFAQSSPVMGSVVSLVALTILMLLQPVGGYISDRIGRRTLLVFFGVGGTLFTWVIFTVLPQSTNPWLSFAILTISFIFLTGYTSINAVVKAELFPTHVRALGVGFGYAIANSIFGGTAPVIYSAAVKANQEPWFIAYVTILIVGSLLVYLFLLRNRGVNWLDHPEEMRRRKDSPGHRVFPMGV